MINPFKSILTRWRAWRQRRAEIRELKNTAAIYAHKVPFTLHRKGLSFQRTGPKGRVTVDYVKIFSVHITEDYFMLHVDTSDLPYRVSIAQLKHEETLENLSASLRTPVTCQFDKNAAGSGFWYLIERRGGLGVVPKMLPVKDLLEVLPPKEERKGLVVPVGMGSNRFIEYCDLTANPHLFILGTTGGGKSNAVNWLITWLISHNSPNELRLFLVDMKGGVEFSFYHNLPHLGGDTAKYTTEEELTFENDDFVSKKVRKEVKRPGQEIIKSADGAEAIEVLEYAVAEIERRLQMFEKGGVKKIETWNHRHAKQKLTHWFIVVDEWAVVMLNKSIKKEAERLASHIARLGRAPGIHLVLCTQTISKEVITLQINNNFQARWVYYCTTGPASGLALGTGSWAAAQMGNVKGRMVWKNSEGNEVIVQSPFIPDGFVKETVETAQRYGEPEKPEEKQAKMEKAIRELIIFAYNERAGVFNRDDLFAAYSDQYSKNFVENVSKTYEGKEFEIEGERYRLEKSPSRGKPRMVVKISSPTPTPATKTKTDDDFINLFPALEAV